MSTIRASGSYALYHGIYSNYSMEDTMSEPNEQKPEQGMKIQIEIHVSKEALKTLVSVLSGVGVTALHWLHQNLDLFTGGTLF
jgi:hypothetical protein